MNELTKATSPLLKDEAQTSPLLKANPKSAAPVAVPSAMPVSQAPAITGKNFGLAEFKRRIWRGELTEEQNIEHALEPSFWRHETGKILGHDQANPLGRGDIIELWKPDISAVYFLLIVEIGKGFIKLERFMEATPKQSDVHEKSGFITRWNVGRKSHDVLRKSDGQVMAGGFQTKASANDWISKHIAAMAA